MDTYVGKGEGTEEFEEDALRDVLAMERQAQGIIQDAEAEAQRIVDSAKQKAEEMRRSAELEIAEKEQATLTQAYETIAQEADAITAGAENSAQAWSVAAQKCFGAAVSFVLDAVTLGQMDGQGMTSQATASGEAE